MKTILFLLSLLMAVCAVPAPGPVATSEDQFLTTVFPSYIVPFFEENPDLANGTQYIANVGYVSEYAGNEIVTIVGFDVPDNGASRCLLKFHLPLASQSNWKIGRNEAWLNVYGLTRPVDNNVDSWNNRPQRYPSTPLATIRALKNQEGIVSGDIPCKTGQRMDFELELQHQRGKNSISWYELRRPRTGITIDTFE